LALFSNSKNVAGQDVSRPCDMRGVQLDKPVPCDFFVVIENNQTLPDPDLR
jgi:hypothetical protein